MTPRKKADDADAQASAAQPARTRRTLRTPLVFVIVTALVFLTHIPVIGLPYYWDEAGYFVPAARDIYESLSFIPHSTLSNAHPPLVMAWVALAWKLLGFHIEVARAAMLLVSSLALVGLFRLGERVANTRVAAASVLCTALYPVFFAQSSLVHLDMAVAALTLWALVFYLPPREEVSEDDALRSGAARRAACVALLALAALAKETAVLVPLTLFGWEVLCLLARRREKLSSLLCVAGRGSPARAAALLLACAPLAAWFAYHRARTGYTLGNPEYFRYNVESTLNLARILDTLWQRFWHVTAHMNLYALTLAGLGAMLLKPLSDRGRERPRISVPVQLLFAALVLAHVTALSVVGGAVLARYMLPVLPLVVLIWVSTLWRRSFLWPLLVAVVCAAFAYRTVVNPPLHSFPWEENLSYRDFVLVHRDAARFLADNYPEARVLTSWPASDELKNPYLGYTPRPFRVLVIENFQREALTRAAAQKSEYDAALLYTTHGGLSLEEAAQVLGGRVVFQRERRGHWAAVIKVSSER